MDKKTVAKLLWRATCQVNSFNDNSNIRLFAVDENNNGNEDENDYVGALIKDIIGEAEDRDKSHQAMLNQVRDSQSLVTKIPWLRHTRWEEIFIGKDMSELVKLSNAPGMQDHHEKRIWDATGRLIRTCFNGVVDCQERGWALTPFWLRSVDRNKEDTKPFRTYFAPATLYRYASYWQQYILFSLRAMMGEESVEFSLTIIPSGND